MSTSQRMFMNKAFECGYLSALLGLKRNNNPYYNGGREPYPNTPNREELLWKQGWNAGYHVVTFNRKQIT